jgi:hypothetical protein
MSVLQARAAPRETNDSKENLDLVSLKANFTTVGRR